MISSSIATLTSQSLSGREACLPQGNNFTYSVCCTPVVRRIINDNIHLVWNVTDEIIIYGKSFSNIYNHNLVKFGGYPCSVTYSNQSHIHCRLDLSKEPPMFQLLEISVLVRNLGNAMIDILDSNNKSIVLKPVYTTVKPNAGSYEGGTNIIVRGYGLHSKSMTIMINDKHCEIIQQSYNNITCISPAHTNNADDLAQAYVADEAQPLFSRHDFSFTYDNKLTPVVNDIQQNQIRTYTHMVMVIGKNFGNDSEKLKLKIGNKVTCDIQNITIGEEQEVIYCIVSQVEAGSYSLTLEHRDNGLAKLNTTKMINSLPVVTSVKPNNGSVFGGIIVEITGHGFCLNSMEVMFDSVAARVVRTTHSVIKVIVPPSGHDYDKDVVVKVQCKQVNFHPELTFHHRVTLTPMISSISPAQGVGGTSVTLTGMFMSDAVITSLTVGSAPCNVSANSPKEILCVLANHPHGNYKVSLNIREYGLSNSNISFQYDFLVSTISPLACGFGGGLLMVVDGRGFDENVRVQICETNCTIVSKDESKIQVFVPMREGFLESIDNQMCKIRIVQHGIDFEYNQHFVYEVALTSTITGVNPKRGGTGGGVLLTITGTQFVGDSSGTNITINGVECKFRSISISVITCITGPSPNTSINADLVIKFANKGQAIPLNGTFSYVDVWSSIYSWGGTSLPKAGNLIFSLSSCICHLRVAIFSFWVLLQELLYYK